MSCCVGSTIQSSSFRLAYLPVRERLLIIEGSTNGVADYSDIDLGSLRDSVRAVGQSLAGGLGVRGMVRLG